LSLPVFVRPARKGEGEKFLEWSKAVPGFDPEVAYHPNTSTLVAYNKNKIIGFLPIQTPFFIETFASNPEATNLEIAQALAEFIKFAVSQAYIKGVPEMYFLGTDDMTNTFALNHVFEEMPYKLYRLKVSDLEPRPQES